MNPKKLIIPGILLYLDILVGGCPINGYINQDNHTRLKTKHYIDTMVGQALSHPAWS